MLEKLKNSIAIMHLPSGQFRMIVLIMCEGIFKDTANCFGLVSVFNSLSKSPREMSGMSVERTISICLIKCIW